MSAVAVDSFKQYKRGLVARHAKPDNLKGFTQVLTTLLPLAALWYAATLDVAASWYGLAIITTLVMSLFELRAFVLMHECGHGSLFRSPALNQAVGFGLGVLTGMPQYVWAQHHNYHHTTNGNWAKYRGPLAILTVDEFDALTPGQQRAYVRARDIRMAPLGGLLYMIVTPRLTWLKGSARLLWHIARGKIAQPGVSVRAHAAQFQTPYWESAAEYWHMTFNNLVLLSVWILMCWLIGPLLFFPIYAVSNALAGGAGIVLFTVQHNFEHSYASGDQGWCYDTAAIQGTSFLDLPAWLNWFTASIGYHHIHHISARIPNYELAACHAEHEQLFAGVRRLRFADIGASLKFILWDPRSRRIISVAEHEAAKAATLDRPGLRA